MIAKEEIKGCKLWNVPLGGLFKHSDRAYADAIVGFIGLK